ncbi:SDR family oxidoreductase [Asticcacaulis sp. ZE23SCel15]|uniref:SDR family oxidoreductase n=1 Tax=Asticcacaulis sp. ZE23SCel15 TaxID=3059027 RepID=UPI00265FD799|nr:SDR family oxidoreductase [Asticcacaulis sp. ZE23SCel15]WKL56700.1 SDR family oxidoreductase [Asticcacaulis sp. ZE23SCel15]
MKLTDNTILITGGAAGIGFALARSLSAKGNRVIICGRSESTLQAAQEKVPALITHVCDIANTESRQSMVDWLRANYPTLNVVINNAGVQYRRDFRIDPSIGTLDQEVGINLIGPIYLIAELLPALKRQQEAFIINVTSALAFSPKADIPVYCATKAAMHAFTLSLRHQLKTTGIRVVEIAPPIVDTGLGGNTRSEGVTSQMMVSPEAFATEALLQLEADKDEVLVGISAELRRLGEALFERMNNRSQ